jgi:hypothetical protein
VLQHRYARSERRAEAAAARRERTAAVLGRVRTFLTDVTPERIGLNVDPTRTPPELDALTVRLSALRDELSILAGADEDDRVMERAANLEVALYNLMHWDKWHVSDLLSHRSAEQSLGLAQHWLARATILVRIVLDLVRGRDVAELESQLNQLATEEPRAGAPSSP